jgi:hypothetical protein
MGISIARFARKERCSTATTFEWTFHGIVEISYYDIGSAASSIGKEVLRLGRQVGSPKEALWQNTFSMGRN